MQKSILIVDDHKFYINEIIEYLVEEGYKVDVAYTYKSGEELIKANTYDFALLDIILQNGKTGFLFAETYGDRIKNIMFITGCNDQATIDALMNSKHASASKGHIIWDTLNAFLSGKTPKIEE